MRNGNPHLAAYLRAQRARERACSAPHTTNFKAGPEQRSDETFASLRRREKKWRLYQAPVNRELILADIPARLAASGCTITYDRVIKGERLIQYTTPEGHRGEYTLRTDTDIEAVVAADLDRRFPRTKKP